MKSHEHPPVIGTAPYNPTAPGPQGSSHLLDVAVQAARAAGEIIRAGWGQTHTVTLKGATNPVTEIDHAAEELIVKTLHAATPDYGILAEESPERMGAGGARWVIDPLDGTVNYAHHFPYFAVSIALERDGRSEVGVVYDPVLDQLFVAERGHGAWLNSTRIQVGTTAHLEKSLIAAGFPYDVWETGANLEELARLTRRVQTVRLNGSAALDLAYVACGRLDAYWDTGLYAWDLAAGRLLVEEAGGLFTLHGGDPLVVESQVMIASNRRLHSQIESIVLPHSP
jgi:myo-inositol-1(or 4)-monophosphatase